MFKFFFLDNRKVQMFQCKRQSIFFFRIFFINTLTYCVFTLRLLAYQLVFRFSLARVVKFSKHIWSLVTSEQRFNIPSGKYLNLSATFGSGGIETCQLPVKYYRSLSWNNDNNIRIVLVKFQTCLKSCLLLIIKNLKEPSVFFKFV